MSFSEGLTSASPTPKPWCDVSFHNVICNDLNAVSISGTPILPSLKAPLTVSGNLASSAPVITAINTNPASNNIDVGLLVENQSGSANMKLIAVNDPSPGLSILTSGGNFLLSTSAPVETISISPNSTQALKSGYISPGVTNTTIQNITVTGSSVVGYVPSILNYYEEYNGTLTFTGPWAINYTRNIYITRIGRLVTLKINGINQTANNTSYIFSTSSIPARFIPTASADSPLSALDVAIIINNGNFTPVGSSSGYLSITPAGIITIYPSVISGTAINYVANGSKSGFNVGFDDISINYSV